MASAQPRRTQPVDYCATRVWKPDGGCATVDDSELLQDLGLALPAPGPAPRQQQQPRGPTPEESASELEQLLEHKRACQLVWGPPAEDRCAPA